MTTPGDDHDVLADIAARADARAAHDVREVPDLRAVADAAAVVDVRRFVHEVAAIVIAMTSMRMRSRDRRAVDRRLANAMRQLDRRPRIVECRNPPPASTCS